MDRFIIDDESTLYKPIEIEIRGKVFVMRPWDYECMQKMSEFDQRISEGENEAQWDRIEFLFGKEARKALDGDVLQTLNNLMKWIIQRVYAADADDGTGKKKQKQIKKPDSKQ